MNCYADFDRAAGRLCIGNDKIEKVIGIRGGSICTASIADKVKGKLWTQEEPKWQLCPVFAAEETPVIAVKSAVVDDHPLMLPHLKGELKLEGKNGTVRYEFIVFDGIPFVYTQAFVHGFGAVTVEEERVAPLGSDGNESEKIDVVKQSLFRSADVLDAIPLAAGHLEVESFLLYDKTDVNDCLAERQTVPVYFRGMLQADGSLFRISDVAAEDSLLLVKHAPTPSSALNRKNRDLMVVGNHYAFLMGNGVDFAQLPDEEIPYYASAVGAADTSEIMEAYWQYSTAFSAGDVSKKLFVMSNTWGDRSQDMAVCEEFMLKEIERGHALGVDVVQIDDGWQSGITINSLRGDDGVWEGFYGANSGFWSVNPNRFPRGLEPLAEKTKEYGMELGLWFSPDSSGDFANYEKDMATLWNFYATYGIRYFKLDGVKIRNKLCEKRFMALLEGLTKRSDGQIRFNLDVTAEDRFGYLYAPQYGTLFVENRYTDWGNYYPHNTFKNLWSLCAAVPARRLQMELLNKSRNPDKYEGMAFAPQLYDMDYLFATVMPANPLVWMEVSHLGEKDAQCLTGITKEYKKYQAELFASRVMPIGQMPNGRQFSGYCCKAPDGKSGHLILFREETKSEEYTFELPVSLKDAEVSVVYENALAGFRCEDDRICVKISKPRGFVWLKFCVR